MRRKSRPPQMYHLSAHGRSVAIPQRLAVQLFPHIAQRKKHPATGPARRVHRLVLAKGSTTCIDIPILRRSRADSVAAKCVVKYAAACVSEGAVPDILSLLENSRIAQSEKLRRCIPPGGQSRKACYELAARLGMDSLCYCIACAEASNPSPLDS